MNDFIESLIRLYKAKKINIEILNNMLNNKKITLEEYKYICEGGDN